MNFSEKYKEWEKELPMGSVFQIESFKLGSDESSSQNCLVSLKGLYQDSSNTFVKRVFVASLMEELEAKNKQQDKLLIEACEAMAIVENSEGSLYGPFISFRHKQEIKELLEKDEHEIT